MFSGLTGTLGGAVVEIVLLLLALKTWGKYQAGDLAGVAGTFLVLVVGAFIYGLSQDHNVLASFSNLIVHQVF